MVAVSRLERGSLEIPQRHRLGAEAGVGFPDLTFTRENAPGPREFPNIVTLPTDEDEAGYKNGRQIQVAT